MNGRIGGLACGVALLVAAVPLPAEEAARTPLKLPTSSQDMRKYMQAGDSNCPGCGVVTSVRHVSVSGSGNAAAEAGDLTNRTGDSGVGDDIRTIPVVGKQKASGKKHAAAHPVWRVAVRYDDGTYATFDQMDQPRVGKGQRIQVVAGRVEPR